MTKTVIKTSDLGHNWFARLYDDGSATVNSPDRGLRIDLPTDSVDRLLDIFRRVDAGQTA